MLDEAFLAKPMKVIVSGLTAAGKTTHARRLARDLGIPYVAMLPVMNAVLAERGSEGDLSRWTPDRDVIRAADMEIDLEADRRMCKAVATDSGVYDAWALPWLYAGSDAVRVWLGSDRASRARKCVVSELRRGVEPTNDPLALIDEKDRFSRAHFARLHGFDLGPSVELFDVIVDNSAHIPEPTIARADAGIAAFHPLLMAAVEEHLVR